MIKTVMQVFEVGIGLTIAVFMMSTFYQIFDSGAINSFNAVFDNFIYLFGYGYTQILTTILCGVFLVMGGRWIMSWASNNGGQTPNNNGN